MYSGPNFFNKRKRGLTFKLLTSTISLILFSVSLISFLSYKQYTKDYLSQSAIRIQQTIELVSLNIDTYLDDLFRLSLSPYYNDDVIAALSNDVDNDNIKLLGKMRTVEGFLDQMMIIPRNDIIRVFILTDEIYKSERISTAIDDSVNFKEYDWYKKALKVQKPVFVPAHLEQLVKNPKSIVFSVVNIIRSTRNTDKILGVIKVDANYAGIESICKKVNMGTKGGLFIIDGNKNIIYSSIKNISYEKFYEAVLKGNKPYIKLKYGNKNYLVNYTKIERANWTIIAVNSLDEINISAIKTRNNSLIISALLSILSIVILTIIIKILLRPLLNIVKLISKIQEGNLNVKFPENDNDEIGYLGTSLNSMVKKINEMLAENTRLVTEVYEAKYLQKEAQINTLFNQIRPHFIYNTLNMISILIQCERYEKAIDNINKLSSLLRGMANWDKDITVKSELELLDSYLGIQKTRYEGRLEYSINVNEKLLDIRIPALILQPVVENSVVHGCEATREITSINIKGFRSDGKIIFTVEDTGKGMSEEEILRLQEKMDKRNQDDTLLDIKNKSSGIGLVNVNRRIKIRYGEDYGLKIESKLNKGTKVIILLPDLL